MNLQKLKGHAMAYLENFKDIRVFNHSDFKTKVKNFVASGQCVPTTELLKAMEKAGSNPQHLAKVIVAHDMNVNKKSYEGREREQHEKDLAEVIQAAHGVYRSSAKQKQKRPAPLSVVS